MSGLSADFLKKKTSNDSGKKLHDFSLMISMIQNVAKKFLRFLNVSIWNNLSSNTEKHNVHGEIQKDLDVVAHEMWMEELSHSGLMHAIVSEESKEVVLCAKGKGSSLIATVDPLDGSSNLDVNSSFGSIFSFYSRKSKDVSLKDFFSFPCSPIMSGYVLYGVSTIIVVAYDGVVKLFVLNQESEAFILERPSLYIPKKSSSSVYSVNEGYSLLWDDVSLRYVQKLKEMQYRLRYGGCMVSDVHQVLMKGGVFGYPGTFIHPNGKLRFWYEVSPMSFVMNVAGGVSMVGMDGDRDVWEDVTKYKPIGMHGTVPVWMGDKDTIDLLKQRIVS